MSIIKFKNRRPWENLITSDFFDMDDFFDNGLWNRVMSNDLFWNGKHLEPALNIRENESSFEIEVAAPGFDKKDFKITADNGQLVISAEKTQEKKEDKGKFTRREFTYNTFERSLQIPENVTDEEVKAHYKNGILSFRLNKKELSKKSQPKIIEVN